jgi:hypothetical protein
VLADCHLALDFGLFSLAVCSVALESALAAVEFGLSTVSLGARTVKCLPSAPERPFDLGDVVTGSRPERFEEPLITLVG